MSETYKRYPFEYDIPPTPPPATFSIWTPDFGSSISPEITNDTVFFTSSDGSVEITGSFEPDTLDFKSSGTASAANVDIDYLADTAITALDVVYVSSTDHVSPANAGSTTTYRAIGFALNGGVFGDTITVRVAGEVPGLSGFNPNDTVFLSPTVSGAITTTVPTGAGDYLVKVGTGRTTTDLVVIIQVLSRRAP